MKVTTSKEIQFKMLKLSRRIFKTNKNVIIYKRSLSGTINNNTKPWNNTMPDEQFKFMRDVLDAPSPVGFESAMTEGVLLPELQPYIEKNNWKVERFKGNAGVLIDTHPGRDDLQTIMLIGHADKIRMQVRHISKDGKVWIDSDSFLPGTLLGNEVKIYSRDFEENPSRNSKDGSTSNSIDSFEMDNKYKCISNGTVEAHGAIHFADANKRTNKDQLYVEFGLHGENRKKQIEKLGIRPGDPVLMDRPIKRTSVGNDTFTGAYLDNGLGCFVVAECAKLLSDDLEILDLNNVRCLFAFASHEEIGRFGSRVMAGEFKPDVLIGVDVNHDYDAAPGVSDKRFPEIEMGKGFTISTGSITAPGLNNMLEDLACHLNIPVQLDVRGRDTGTDAMAGVLASIDCAATSIGFPIRNMHTVSECGHTGDVLCSIHALHALVKYLNTNNTGEGTSKGNWETLHPRLDL